MDIDRILAIKSAAQGRLRALPGVHAVAIGPKISGGQQTGELSIIVYTVKKKPLAELPAARSSRLKSMESRRT
jgi:hypothetical protein